MDTQVFMSVEQNGSLGGGMTHALLRLCIAFARRGLLG